MGRGWRRYASHYPAGVQERDYQGEVEEQAKVRANAGMSAPEYFINTNPDAINGPPIVTPEGVTLGGNSRVMSLALAYGENQGKAGAKYRQMLARRARTFGLDPAQVLAMKRPVLVRTVDPGTSDPQALHRLVSALNAPPTQAMGAEAEAVSRGKRTRPATLEMIAGLLNKADGATIRGLLDEPKAARRVLDALGRDGVIRKTEWGKYWSSEHKRITAEGKNLVESALLGAVLPDYNLLRVAPPWLRQALGRNLDHLAKLKARGGAWDLTRDLTQAVELVLAAEAAPTDVEGLRGWLAQASLPGMERVYSPKAQAMALALVENKPNDLRAALKAHAADAPADVAGQQSLVPLLTPMQSFARHFGRVDDTTTLGQPLNEDVDPEAKVKVLDISGVAGVRNFTAKEARKFENRWKGASLRVKGAEGRWWKIGLYRKDPDHVFWSSHEKGRVLRSRRNALKVLDQVLENAVLVESFPQGKRGQKPDIATVHRFYTPVRVGNQVKTLRVVALEQKGADPVIDGVELYDLIEERKSPLVAQGQRPSVTGTKSASPGGSSEISIRQMLSGVKDSRGETYYQTAYHGSPHRFDLFSLEHIGTGEGAQAYGWGLYFAGKREVAEWYRANLLPASEREKATINQIAETYLNAEGGDAVKAKAVILEDMAKDWSDTKRLKKALRIIETGKPLKIKGGQLYKVSLPDDDVLLAWDKPLSEQPEAVRSKLAAIISQYADQDFKDKSGSREAKTHDRLVLLARDMRNMPGSVTGERIYSSLGKALTGHRAASKYLNSIGIKGHRYLDGSSRGNGDGSHNYVIYDDNAIGVMETYYQQRLGADAKRGSVTFMPDGRAVIQILRYGDASTLVHELGHIARRGLAEMATAPGAGERVKADYKAMCEFVGADPSEPWTPDQEEKLAQAFEQYVLEGKAPAPRLRGALVTQEAAAEIERREASKKAISQSKQELGLEDDDE